MAIVLDAQAVVAYLSDEPGGVMVRDLIVQATKEGQRILMSVVNMAEVFYVIERRRGPDATASLPGILAVLAVEAVPADVELARAAARLKASNRMSLADCFAAALAKSLGAQLVTGDRDFEQVKAEVSVVWLP